MRHLLYFLVATLSLIQFGSAFGPSCNLQLSSRQDIQHSRSSSSCLYFGLGAIAEQEQKYFELAQSNTDNPNPPASVHIVAYNAGTPVETIHFTEYPQDQYCLLAFESAQECEHFADLIQVGQPGDFSAETTEYSLEDIFSYCQENQLPLQLVPEV